MSLLEAAFLAGLKAFEMPALGIHGPEHWLRVLKNGRELVARTPGADLEVVECFAVLHDCKRQRDDFDAMHGQRAGSFVGELWRAGGLALDPGQLYLLQRACAEHELGMLSPDPTIGACWDADRLELSRLGRQPIPRLLSTSAARDPGLLADAWQRGFEREIDAEEPLNMRWTLG